MAAAFHFDSPEFDHAVQVACHDAFLEAIAAGLPVFYIDADGLDVLERPDGRRFEIHWRPGAPAGENFEIVRELAARAA